jgi:hypothetical protein
VATPVSPTPTPPPTAVKEDTESKPLFQDSNTGYYLGTKSKANPANITGYVNEGGIPNMLHNPEDVDDLLDVPSFQRIKITERKAK